MRTNFCAVLVLNLVVCGCGVSYPATTPSYVPAEPSVQAESFKGDIQEVIDRAIAQDDVIMGEAGKAKSPADQARLTKQAYHILFAATSEVNDRASKLNLNPFTAKKREAILAETQDSIWKLRYLEKEGGAKANDDEARLAHYERLHQEALGGLNRVQTILKNK